MSEDIIRRFEAALDLYNPEGGEFGCRALGYGEVSVVLSLDALPGKALKRVSGFTSERETATYIDAVRRYIELITARGISVLPTSCFAIRERSPVVYFMQPAVEIELLGNSLLQSADGHELTSILKRLLDCLAANLRANRTDPHGPEVAPDAQLSNWYFPNKNSAPQLVDVGSPITRINGQVLVYGYDDTLYRSVCWPLSAILKRIDIVNRYYRDYFDLRLNILDILGNFIKEKASHRLPEAVAGINDWLRRQPEGDTIGVLTVDDAYRYYKKDALLLELTLQVRRITRFIRTNILRTHYDYILPGRIDRK